MPLMEQLLGIENALAGGSDAQYRRHLDDDAVVIIPGQALSKDDTVAAVGRRVPGGAGTASRATRP